MTIETPLVSVGVPIYNADSRIQQILDTLCAQTYANLEINISDNASTDHTWDICQEYAQRDSRIKVHRNAVNQGAVENFHQVFRLSSGKYFLWVAHDDDREPDYISACVSQLEQHPEAVLCYSDQRFINLDTGTEHTLYYQIDGENPTYWRRAKTLLSHKPTPYSLIYGMYRRESITPFIPMPNSPIFDIHFLLQVAQKGTLVHIPRVLFTKNVTVKDFHSRMRSIHPRYERLPAFAVYLIMFLHLLKFSWSAGEGIGDKFHLSMASARYAVPRIITHMIPVSVRRWLRNLSKRNPLVAKALKPLLSTKQVID
jgi:glycosyltransferase involved in cell wall biosynthesis